MLQQEGKWALRKEMMACKMLSCLSLYHLPLWLLCSYWAFETPFDPCCRADSEAMIASSTGNDSCCVDVRYCTQGKLENGFWQSQDGIERDFGVFPLNASSNLASSGEAGAVWVTCLIILYFYLDTSGDLCLVGTWIFLHDTDNLEIVEGEPLQSGLLVGLEFCFPWWWGPFSTYRKQPRQHGASYTPLSGLEALAHHWP